MPGRAIEPADKPIKAVLAEFLSDQRNRLKPTTLNRYESIIALFEASMDLPAAEALAEMLAAHADATTAPCRQVCRGVLN